MKEMCEWRACEEFVKLLVGSLEQGGLLGGPSVPQAEPEDLEKCF